MPTVSLRSGLQLGKMDSLPLSLSEVKMNNMHLFEEARHVLFEHESLHAMIHSFVNSEHLSFF
jgi:hypothetical protein